MIHALTILPLAVSVMNMPSLQADPVFGYDHGVGNVLALSCGCVHPVSSELTIAYPARQPATSSGTQSTRSAIPQSDLLCMAYLVSLCTCSPS
jgi:hypothetical protein